MMNADLFDALSYLITDARRNGNDIRECSEERVHSSLIAVLRLIPEYSDNPEIDAREILES